MELSEVLHLQWTGREEDFIEQMVAMDDLQAEDRVMFALATMLPGTVHAKRLMTLQMMRQPVMEGQQEAALEDGIDLYDTEPEGVLHLLRGMNSCQALTVLSVLAEQRVNNRRTRRLILRYLFERDKRKYVGLAAKHRPAVRRLVRHALGGDLVPILRGDFARARRLLGRGVKAKLTVVRWLFGRVHRMSDLQQGLLRRLGRIDELKYAAMRGDEEAFTALLSKDVPVDVALGYRQDYLLDGVDIEGIKAVCGHGCRLVGQKIIATEDSGVRTLVDKEAADAMQAWMMHYEAMHSGDTDLVARREKELDQRAAWKYDLRFGRVVIVIDASEQMRWERFFMAVTIASLMPGVVQVVYAGGTFQRAGEAMVVEPGGTADLAEAIRSATTMPYDTLLVLSQGASDDVRHAAVVAWQEVQSGREQLIHIAPAPDGQAWEAIEGEVPLVLWSVERLRGAYLQWLMETNPELARRELLKQYRYMIGKERGEREFLLT